MAEARTPNKRHDLRSKLAMVRESPLKDSVDIMRDEVLLLENLCVFRPSTDICRTGFLCIQRWERRYSLAIILCVPLVCYSGDASLMCPASRKEISLVMVMFGVC